MSTLHDDLTAALADMRGQDCQWLPEQAADLIGALEDVLEVCEQADPSCDCEQSVVRELRAAIATRLGVSVQPTGGTR